MAIDSIASRLFSQARAIPNHSAYFVKSGEEWKSTSWNDYAAEVRTAARALISLGLEP